MPPRRSCFFSAQGWADWLRFCFNATTAFLLPRRRAAWLLRPGAFQCHHGVPASHNKRGGPPLGIPFQCHHGVPASRKWGMEGATPHSSFNATTAFLLRDHSTPTHPVRKPFQCHHGVPASSSRPRSISPAYRFQCHHGVPASSHPIIEEFQLASFQCHHGVPAS